MPTFGQSRFIRRAVESVLTQSLADWELVIVDDGSPDDTAGAVGPYLADPRIRYERRPTNEGVGAALNFGMGLARSELVAYLPSDDQFFPDHLASLAACLDAEVEASLAFSGVRSEYRVPGKGVLSRRSSDGQIDGMALQLVQVMHRRSSERWLERRELVTDDLERMFWSKLRPTGAFVGTGLRSCEWVDHPAQWHKVVQEPLGGINPYRSRYGVSHPLRFQTSVGNSIDEVDQYRHFRDRPATPPASDRLKILLVGELAFNAERVLALEERGHELFGLWTPDPHWFNTVGPLPFGHVQDLPRADWAEAIAALQPDVIYALLNWEAVPFAHQVLTAELGVPFVWHFKESPFDCMANGTWPQLVDLLTASDGQIYTSPEMRDWFATVDPRIVAEGHSMVLDGDLPKADWFDGERSPRLSEADGEVHTVIPGGPIGVDTRLIGALAVHGVHVHFYGDFHRGQWSDWVTEAQRAAPGHFHLHPQVGLADWVTELSQYDAGWLHQLQSTNDGSLCRADWGDLNYPARMATLAVAGVPMIVPANPGSVVAMRSLVQERDLGVLYGDADDLAAQLCDRGRMAALGDSVWRQRQHFVFDSHADELVRFLRTAIDRAGDRRAAAAEATTLTSSTSLP